MVTWDAIVQGKAAKKKVPKVYQYPCSGIAWDARASDALIVENNKPNDDLALLVGIERLDQLFDLYYIDIKSVHSRVEFVL